MHVPFPTRILPLIALLAGLLLASTVRAEEYAVNAFGDSITDRKSVV